jgi:hypothetical protein
VRNRHRRKYCGDDVSAAKKIRNFAEAAGFTFTNGDPFATPIALKDFTRGS